MGLDLALVMPVYNEEACIAGVVRAWRDMLTGLGIEFCMIVLNDGSTDGTAAALGAFALDGRVKVVNKENAGHGPTILLGYGKAVELADWVFQCDSDDEMKPDAFPELWKKRNQYDALLGIRQDREQSSARRIISACSQATVHCLFGRGVADVNVPYRLIRSEILARIVSQIPPGTFAPNVIISGALARFGARICNHPVPHENRRTGTASIVKWKLWKAAFRSLWQTLRCRPKIKANVSNHV